MFDDLPTLTHAEQQVAVEKIQKLMAEGISTGEGNQDCCPANPRG